MRERTARGHPLGLHRVLDPEPRLPQAAKRLDNSLPIFSNEILIDVHCLNIDAASFVQMEKQSGGSEKRIASMILHNTRQMGKQQNPVTQSGGMLMGRVSAIGSRYRGEYSFQVGDLVATLVSLTLTPLHIESVLAVDKRSHQLRVKGHAILFESAIAAKLPRDVPQGVATAVYDVAGAPATVNALCRKNDRVLVIGAGGKAGILACFAARQKVGPLGKVFAVEPSRDAAWDLRRLDVCDGIWGLDATDAVAVFKKVQAATKGNLADVVVNVASVSNTELGAILSSHSGGKVLLFSMATSFTRVALGAEGVASRAKLIIGNGYYPGHARFAIQLLRRFPNLFRLFSDRYAGA